MSTTPNQQFEGATLEEALETAVAGLGDDLQILDAQRVQRRGLLGKRRRERYEVTASAAPMPKRAGPHAAAAAGFDDVLARMIDRVDDAERADAAQTMPGHALGADLADTDKEWWSEADFVVPVVDATAAPSRMQPQPAADIEVDVRLEPARASAQHPSLAEQAEILAAQSRSVYLDQTGPPRDHDAAGAMPDPRLGQETVPETGLLPDGSSATTADARATVAAASAAPAWSGDALLALGLPPALVGRIRPAGTDDDLAWVGALSKAIEELLDTASHVSGSCELTGHGAASAVQLLRGACDGFRLDSLVIEGRRVPASPLELALAIRSLLPSVRAGCVSPVAPTGVMALVGASTGRER